MKAVIRTGGKQYLVGVGDVIDVEKVSADEKSKIIFAEVLMLADDKDVQLGDPVLKNASVEGEVAEQFKADKIVVFKMKRRKRYRKTQGHRQQLTKVKITKINTGL